MPESRSAVREPFNLLGEITIMGRPDFADHSFGVTYAKKFPPYVYSINKRGYLIHKVTEVEVRWWEGHYDRMVRLRKPKIIAHTICGCSRFIQSGGRLKASLCAIPKPDATLCKRCMGEATSTFPRKDPTSKERAKMARIKLGCIAMTEATNA